MERGSSDWQSAVDIAHHECQYWVNFFKLGEFKANQIITPARGHLDKFKAYNYFCLLKDADQIKDKLDYESAKNKLKKAIVTLKKLKSQEGQHGKSKMER